VPTKIFLLILDQKAGWHHLGFLNCFYSFINRILVFSEEIIVTNISANELKTKGVSVIQAVLDQQTEAVISVRGKQRFVVMGVEHYQYLRECELSAAIIESKADIEAGHYIKESAEEHLARLESME